MGYQAIMVRIDNEINSKYIMSTVWIWKKNKKNNKEKKKNK